MRLYLPESASNALTKQPSRSPSDRPGRDRRRGRRRPFLWPAARPDPYSPVYARYRWEAWDWGWGWTDADYLLDIRGSEEAARWLRERAA